MLINPMSILTTNNHPSNLFQRHKLNPILTAANWPYQINSVFNPGATLLADGTTLLLCRPADFRIGESRIWFFSWMWEHGRDKDRVEFLAEFAGNKNVAQFTDHEINSYLVCMRTEYGPSRWSGDTRKLSPKTLRNIWITMCSFFRRANSGFHII